MAERFGEFKKVSVRTLWPNEQANFTPWLAEEANIAKLAEALRLELEVENIEVAVGPYSADILAKEGSSGSYVIIENQFGKTNHDHLGKLIVYGSFLDASAVIWIAEEFTEEHRKALEWLNDHSSEEIGFYGVVLEVWQIDESRPAVRFDVVSRPVEIMRQASAAKSAGTLSDTKRLQLEFWTEFRSHLLKRKVVPSAMNAQPQGWFDVPLGRSGFVLSNLANTSQGRLSIRVYMREEVADAALEQLQRERDKIESEIGEPLEWNPKPDYRDKVIALQRDADFNDRQRWPEYCDWLVDRVAKFRKAFVPRIKKLDLEKRVEEPDGAKP